MKDWMLKITYADEKPDDWRNDWREEVKDPWGQRDSETVYVG